ncbi:phasin family protein [Cereibacter johrii]|uniref:phasin family protein n=1 Tax=Cereibacter johrii TaxID=445629 RepID=UPI000DCC8EEE|nr:phasin family protein [Cereibacter johrii]QCP84854.1 hypothetical protein EYE35_03910 [Cereibacter sphaeroides]RAZ82302.1 hypothetical protein DDV93_20160 [Cereibacter johrii]
MANPKSPQDTRPPLDAEGLRQVSMAFQGGTAGAYELWLRLAHEISHFTADRICETVKTQQQMMHCHSLSELAHLRAQWLQRAMDQYAEEAGRMAGIWRETLERTVRIRTD